MGIRDYLNEATFSTAHLSKVSMLLSKVLSKKVGVSFNPMGGKDNIEVFTRQGGKGVGIRYILDNGRMVRFNWEKSKNSSTITSLDLWMDLSDLGRPDYTLYIPTDFNIVKIVDELSSFIKVPRIGQLVKENLTEAAVKVTPEKQELADKWGVDVKLPMTEFNRQIREKEKILKAAKGTPEENDILKQIEADQKRLDNKYYADPEVIFDDLDDLSTMVILGHSPSLLITGMAGIGKTYTVTKLAKTLLGPEGQRWIIYKGKITPLALYSTLFRHRDKLIIFDDADSVFDNQDSINILKNALDSYSERLITYSSAGVTVDVSKLSKDEINQFHLDIEEKLDDDPAAKVKFPNRFYFNGRVIFISNIHESKMDSAIKSRSFVIDITLKARDVIKRMESVLPDIGGDVSLSEKKEVLSYLKEETESSKREVNMRTLILALKIKQSGSQRWQHLVSKYA